jgi:hypothetical protein
LQRTQKARQALPVNLMLGTRKNQENEEDRNRDE